MYDWTASTATIGASQSVSTWYLQARSKVTNNVYETIASNKTLTDAPIASGQLVEIELNGALIRCSVGGVLVYEVWDSYLQGSAMVGLTLTNTPNALIEWAGVRPIRHAMGLYS